MADRYASLKQGLVGCWIPSVSGSGLLLPDLSGRNNNGSLVGMDASDWVSGQYGRALDFDGVNDKVAIPNTQAFVSGTQLTVSLWVKRNLAGAYYELINKFIATAAANEDGWLFRWDNNNKLLFTVAQSGTYSQYLATDTSTTIDWTHVAVIHEFGTATKTSLFFNGQLISAAWSGNGALIPDADATADNILLGSQFYANLDYNLLAGQLDDIRTYNRILSPAEICVLASEPGIGFKPAKKLSRFSQRFTYNPPKARNYGVVRVKETDYATLRQGLVGAWCPSLPNGGSGNTLPDQSGYNNHGSLVGMGPEDWVSGQYGRALDFDGSNDVVEANRIDLVSAGTLAAWVKLAGNGAIIIKQSTIANQWDYALYCATSAGNTRLYFYADGLSPTNFVISPSQLSSDWTHVVGMKTATQILLFVNGVQVASASATNNFQQRDFKVYLGYDFRDSASRGVIQIDDARIYNRPLSEPEIKLLASRPGIGLRQESHRQTFYQFPSGSRRKRILTGMP